MDPGQNMRPAETTKPLSGWPARRRKPTAIVPAKDNSAATPPALGPGHIMTAPSSSLTPVAPQLCDRETLITAKDIITAADDAIHNVSAEPTTAATYNRLSSSPDAITLQEERAASDSSDTPPRVALMANPDRDDEAKKTQGGEGTTTRP